MSKFIIWTAVAWAVLFLGIVAIDVGYTAWTGEVATPSVVQKIEVGESEGLKGWMGRVAWEVDRWGDVAFGDRIFGAELVLYGILAPLFLAGPVGWEARRREWSAVRGGVVLAVAVSAIGAWGISKAGITALYYACVNALWLACRAVGLSYYEGSFLYFLVLPPAVLVGYVLWRGWVGMKQRTESE